MNSESDVDRETRQALFDQVRRHTGIAMNERKWLMLQGRLRRRLHALELGSYQEYLRVLETRPAEVIDFVNLVTTNETWFFRTPRIWEYFADQFLPQWFDAHPGAVLRVWSAAASTGEEAYSAAMVCEEFRAAHPSFRYHVLGTDIGEAVLQRAAAAEYRGRNVETLRKSHPALIEKYFTAIGEGIQAKPMLRANVAFRQHNLYASINGVGAADLVFLRNVLIYFDAEGQQTVVENVRRAMAADGILVIGESESLGRLDTGFAFEHPLIYRNRCRRRDEQFA